MLARVTGVVLATERVRGTTHEGKDYDFVVTRVLMAGQDVTPVQSSPANTMGPGRTVLAGQRGELVDWLVSIGVYRNEPSCRLEGVFDESAGLDLGVVAS